MVVRQGGRDLWQDPSYSFRTQSDGRAELESGGERLHVWITNIRSGIARAVIEHHWHASGAVYILIR